MPDKKKKPSGALDMISLWDAVDRFKLTESETSIALAVFALEYVDNTDRQVTSYSQFNRN